MSSFQSTPNFGDFDEGTLHWVDKHHQNGLIYTFLEVFPDSKEFHLSGNGSPEPGVVAEHHHERSSAAFCYAGDDEARETAPRNFARRRGAPRAD